MNLAYDPHIHSYLSPCGDDDVTPTSIADMATLEGLEAIVLTDRNICRNCSVFLAAAAEYGISAIPGMEISTSEEAYAVCPFSSLESALDFDVCMCARSIKFPSNETIFGKQQIYDGQDHVRGTEPNLLINVTEISFDGLRGLVRSYGGVMFLTHMDKMASSLIANLGLIPPDNKFTIAEVKDLRKLHQLKQGHPCLDHCRIISNSNAHYLEHINKPELTLQAKGKTPQGIINAPLLDT